MTVLTGPLLADSSYVRELAGLYEPWSAASAPAPALLVLNDALAAGASRRASAGRNVA